MLIAGCAALMAGGCAKKELVKNDEAIAPAADTAAKPAANNEAAQTAVKLAPAEETTLNGEANQSMTQCRRLLGRNMPCPGRVAARDLEFRRRQMGNR